MVEWFAWLLLPIEPARAHNVGVYLAWHARLMFVIWTFLVPLAIVVARYCKILPSQNWPQQLDNQTWWVTHQVLQYTSALLSIVAVGLVLLASRSAVAPGPHALLGWSVMALVVLQVIGGWLRGSKGGPTDAVDGSLRGDHYDMSGRRIVFEYVHKTCGYFVVLLAIAAVSTGLWQSNAPRWMWLVQIIWWVLLFVVVFVLQKRSLAIDTYQAIWGPDPSLPGNLRKPIGVGVRQVKKPNNHNN